ncbi:MAG TPA: DUF4255 domain-containing protein [Thermoanaerobaculia bacterium]|nr:DUF4255 domain-containing protein [Thermoanaerobaculia bacterium]
MSDFRAVAAVTATLQNMLQSAVAAAVPGAIVRTGRPEKNPSTTSPGEVNIFLYQVSPNAAFRNLELPVRRSDGSIVRPPTLALDLHFLLSFYGDDAKQIPQLLLGIVTSTMHTYPFPRVEDMPGHGNDVDNPLAGSGIEAQADRLRFAPMLMSHDELSKLWSIFFQVPYALSASYLCSVVLIESDLTPQPSLPIRRAGLAVQPEALPPQLERVSPQTLSLSGDARITISGSNLLANDAVRFGSIEASPQSATKTSLVVALPADLPAGVQQVQAVRRATGMASNPLAFVLQPSISGAVRFDASGPSLAIPVQPPVVAGQRVSVLLNETGAPAGRAPRSYAFPASGIVTGPEVTIPVPGAEAGTYLVRVQVDGIASPLAADLDPRSATFNQYTSPKVVIP